jgi:hypothetical protein
VTESHIEPSPCPCCPDPAPPAGVDRRALLRWGLGGAGAATLAAGLPLLGSTIGSTLGDLAGLGDPAGALTARPDWPAPPIVSRAGWGCDESLRKPGQEYSTRVEKLIVHHTVTPNNPADPAAVLRGVYVYHTSGVYIDIAYNFVIDHNGRIYQGRWAANGDKFGERNGKQVVGGHTLGFNYRTIGVALLGTHTTVPPTAAAVDSLVALLTWKCARWGINPGGATSYVKSNGDTVVTPNIMSHRDGVATTCPGDPVVAMLPTIRQRVRGALGAGALPGTGASGYWIADAHGRVFAYGVPDLGDPARAGTVGTFVGIAAHPTGRGYWVAGQLGGVFPYGEARFFGSMYGRGAAAPMVDIAPTPSGNGYWLLGADGGVFTFGDAGFFGSTGGMRLNSPVRKLVPTPTGKGYWLLAGDGGVFSFGDARFFGSTGGLRLNAPVVGMAATPTRNGYWLLGRDGGIFTFGDAQFYGSTGGMRLNSPVVDILATRSGRGYVLVAADGGVFTFGDAPFRGSAAGRTGSAIAIAGVLS